MHIDLQRRCSAPSHVAGEFTGIPLLFPLGRPARGSWAQTATAIGIKGSSAFFHVRKAPLFKQVAALSCLKGHCCSALLGFQQEPGSPMAAAFLHPALE